MKTARRNQAQSVAGGPFEDGQAQEGSPFLLTTTNSINSGDQQIETKLARNLRCRGLVHSENDEAVLMYRMRLQRERLGS